MSETNWSARLFQSIDKKDTAGFSEFLSENVMFRFGNAEPVSGKHSATAVVGGFFGSIQGIRHDVTDTWEVDGAVICHGMVTYTRPDSSTLTVPFANIFKMDGVLIKEYLIFVDVSGLY